MTKKEHAIALTEVAFAAVIFIAINFYPVGHLFHDLSAIAAGIYILVRLRLYIKKLEKQTG